MTGGRQRAEMRRRAAVGEELGRERARGGAATICRSRMEKRGGGEGPVRMAAVDFFRGRGGEEPSSPTRWRRVAAEEP